MTLTRPVAVGVTGHRILAEVDRVASGVDAVLGAIESAFPGRGLKIVSALAEGADRLVAQRALSRPGAVLDVLFPLPREDYEQGLTQESRRDSDALLQRAQSIVTLPPAPSRDAAYEAGGRYVLDHSDVVLAIWDGRDAQGRGGTGAIVAEARRRGLPVAWVHAGNRRPGTLEPTTLGEQQGTVVYERFPPALDVPPPHSSDR